MVFFLWWCNWNFWSYVVFTNSQPLITVPDIPQSGKDSGYLNFFQHLLGVFSTCFISDYFMPNLLLIIRPIRWYMSGSIHHISSHKWSKAKCVKSDTSGFVSHFSSQIKFAFSFQHVPVVQGYRCHSTRKSFSRVQFLQHLEYVEKVFISLASSLLTFSSEIWIHQQDVSSRFIITFPQ